MTNKERLETIKELVKKIESIIYDEWRQQELTNLIESLYYDDHVDWLIQQAEKIELLNAEIETLQAKWEAQGLMIQKLHRENQRYKQALEFYADEEHYREKLISEAQYDADGICISNDEYAPPIIYFDSGEKGRQALKEKRV